MLIDADSEAGTDCGEGAAGEAPAPDALSTSECRDVSLSPGDAADIAPRPRFITPHVAGLSVSLRPHPRLLGAMSSTWAITSAGWQSLQHAMLTGAVSGWQNAMQEMDPERIRARSEHMRTKGMIWDGDERHFDPYYDAHIRPSGVGVLPVRGPLFDRGWMCFQGYDQIRAAVKDFAAEFLNRRARKDLPPLSMVVMPIGSPGGMCVGLDEVCADLRALREIVPVITCADKELGSAAEAIASQGTLSFADPEGSRGHIGTWADHQDWSEFYKAMGIDVRYYARGQYKVFFQSENPRGPETDEVMNHAADFYYGKFVDMVAAGRPSLTPDAIRATEARIYLGDEAVAAGLADGVATYDELLFKVESSLTAPGGA